ncbi:hypothetical protein CPT11_28200 [Klebsiella pneumoniae]|nr:hypothetical protein CPT11_28200 [Klebsiella pneumoniae]
MNRLTDDPRWLPAMSERVTRMVQRDRNHPSVSMWWMKPILKPTAWCQ